jgi:hypothetical protein
MKKNPVQFTLRFLIVFLITAVWISSAVRAQIPCYNVCQKTMVLKGCNGESTQSVEFINISCDQGCPPDEHTQGKCPCTWEMWREITEVDCEGVTHYSVQKLDDFPCGTNPKPDESYTIPCNLPNGPSSMIHRSEKYMIHQNNCVCDEYSDVTYQFIDMDCHKKKCKKTVTKEFCDGSIVHEEAILIDVPCPGDCPPDEHYADTVCYYDCGVISTYYDCDDPETVDYVEPMQIVTYTYNCSNHDIPICPADEEFFEDCDIYGCLNEKFQRKVTREYHLERKDCTKAVRIDTVYELAE